MLADLGYDDETIAGCPTPLGITSPFRLLSEEGVACLHEVARQLEPHARSIERISRMVRGGVYQSRFLRDFCTSPELSEFISEICDASMLPHTMPHQLGHLNYNPHTIGENVDKWHADTLRVDFVLFVTDPTAIAGGEFQYFNGTKAEADALRADGKSIPQHRVVSPDLPGAGYAVLQQGNMVVHRARRLDAPGERITLVNGYVPADVHFPDFTRFDQLFLADPQHVATSEYTRHAAWIGRERLDRLISESDFVDDRDAFAGHLDTIARE
ncbi:MAG: hypothetical protein AAGK78_07960, partial [Planctomycetota bacterium]